jgi:flagellar hook-length control protein FliK
MNNAPIDYVLSVPPPRPDSASGPPRPRDDAPRFDSHFRQESEAREPTPPPPAPSRSQASPTSSTASSAAPPQRERAAADRPEKGQNDAAQPADQPRDEREKAADETASAAASEAQPTPVVAAVPVRQIAAEAVKALTSGPQDQHVADDGTQEPASHEAPKTSVPTKPRVVQTSANAQPETTPVEVGDESIDPQTAAPADTATQAVAAQAGEDVAASTGPLPAVATEKAADVAPATVPDSKPSAKPKPNKVADGHTPPAPTDARGDERPQVRASAPGEVVEIASSVASGNPDTVQAATDESSADQQQEKRVERKSTAATNDQTSPDRPTVAASNRAASLNPAAPLVANVVANVDPAQTAATSPDASESELKTQSVKPAAKEGLLSPFARLERGGPLNAHANRVAGTRDAAPHVDPARFVSRVARAVQTAHERGTPLQLRLSPPELGTLRLELTVRGGALTASIETDNANARQVLLDNLPALRDRLAEQNVRIERFDVDVRRDGTGDGSGGRPNAGPQHQGHDHQRHAAPHRTNTARESTNQTTDGTPPPVRRTITNTSINVIA